MAALELVETETFDFAILDVKIPKISGLELKKRLHDPTSGNEMHLPDRTRL